MKRVFLIGLDTYGLDFITLRVPTGMWADQFFALADAQKQFSAQGELLDHCIVKIDGSEGVK